MALLLPIAFSRIFHLSEYGNWLGREKGKRRGNWSTNGIESNDWRCAWIVIFLCLFLSVSNIIQSFSDKSASAAEIDIIAVVLAGRSPILSFFLKLIPLSDLFRSPAAELFSGRRQEKEGIRNKNTRTETNMHALRGLWAERECIFIFILGTIHCTYHIRSSFRASKELSPFFFSTFLQLANKWMEQLTLEASGNRLTKGRGKKRLELGLHDRAVIRSAVYIKIPDHEIYGKDWRAKISERMW